VVDKSWWRQYIVDMTASQAKEWIITNWDRLRKEGRFVPTILRYNSRFLYGDGKANDEIEEKDLDKEETVQELARRAKKVFGEKLV